jgi:hypothetical protein
VYCHHNTIATTTTSATPPPPLPPPLPPASSSSIAHWSTGPKLAAVAAAAVCVCVCDVCASQLIFSILPSLLTNPFPRAQAAQTQHGIRSGALPNSAAAEEHLDEEFAKLPPIWSAKGGRHGHITVTKTDPEAVIAYRSEPKRAPTTFYAISYTLDALVALYNNLVFGNQSDPMRAMQGIGSRNPGGRPGKSS